MFQPKPTPGDTGKSDSRFPEVSNLDQFIENQDENYLDPSKHDLTGKVRDPVDDDGRRKRRDLFCFHCNRMETHSLAPRFGVIYSFLIGLTLGLVKLIGPFYCRCCSHGRLFGWDQVHPKYWLHQRRLRKHSSSRKSRRR